MKASITLIGVLTLALAAGSAFAEEAAAAKAEAATKTEDAKVAQNDKRTRMVCTTEKVTGSRFAKRVCMTEEESERMREAGKEAVERVQRMPIPIMNN